MKVHADVLRMAGSKEKRDRIVWHHARLWFFGWIVETRIAGLALSRECDLEEARLLVSLFPDGPPKSDAEAAKVFLAHDDDACCLCWAALTGAQPIQELLERSAGKGYSLAQFHLANRMEMKGKATERLALLEKAAAQGEPLACQTLACTIAGAEKERAGKLFRQAAEFGEAFSQCEFAHNYCPENSLERFVWLRRSVRQNCWRAVNAASFEVVNQMKLYDSGGGSGRIVFEVGSMFFSSSIGMMSKSFRKNIWPRKELSIYI